MAGELAFEGVTHLLRTESELHRVGVDLHVERLHQPDVLVVLLEESAIPHVEEEPLVLLVEAVHAGLFQQFRLGILGIEVTGSHAPSPHARVLHHLRLFCPVGLVTGVEVVRGQLLFLPHEGEAFGGEAHQGGVHFHAVISIKG